MAASVQSAYSSSVAVGGITPPVGVVSAGDLTVCSGVVNVPQTLGLRVTDQQDTLVQVVRDPSFFEIGTGRPSGVVKCAGLTIDGGFVNSSIGLSNAPPKLVGGRVTVTTSACDANSFIIVKYDKSFSTSAYHGPGILVVTAQTNGSFDVESQSSSVSPGFADGALVTNDENYINWWIVNPSWA